MVRFIAGVLVGAFSAAYAIGWFLSSTPDTATSGAASDSYPWPIGV